MTGAGTASLEGIVTGPDGALWFTEYNDDKIGRITTAGGITEFNVTLPQQRSRRHCSGTGRRALVHRGNQ